MSAGPHERGVPLAPLVVAGAALLALLGAATRRLPAITACGGSRGGAACECGPL
jgi:hypothetical protein